MIHFNFELHTKLFSYLVKSGLLNYITRFCYRTTLLQFSLYIYINISTNKKQNKYYKNIRKYIRPGFSQTLFYFLFSHIKFSLLSNFICENGATNATGRSVPS